MGYPQNWQQPEEQMPYQAMKVQRIQRIPSWTDTYACKGHFM
jgi:hypothetical protein